MKLSFDQVSIIRPMTDNSKFFINFLHAWSWWEIISYFFDFKFYLFTIIYSRVTFIHQRGDLCEIIIFSFTVCVQFGVSMYMRKSVKWQRKYHYISFIYVLSKCFISNSVNVVILTFTPGVCATGGGDFFDMYYNTL